MNHGYRAHGLRVHSEIELPLPVAPAGAPDLVLRRGPDRAIPDERQPGERLAELCRADGSVFYRLTRDGASTVLRYPGLCEFRGDAGFADLTVHLDRNADPGMLPVLIAGAVLAIHLLLRRELVLHASAVETRGRAVAFVGASGMGKSTLSAALCGIGCGLVADDVLRVEPDGHGMAVHPGSTESRLRESAMALAEAAPAGAVSITADGRLALRSRTWVDGRLPLAACVVPSPDRAATDVSVRLLSPARALVRLSGFPRVLGWHDAASLAHGFQALADLIERVPVFEATVPWGLPFRDSVLFGLLEAVTAQR